MNRAMNLSDERDPSAEEADNVASIGDVEDASESDWIKVTSADKKRVMRKHRLASHTSISTTMGRTASIPSTNNIISNYSHFWEDTLPLQSALADCTRYVRTTAAYQQIIAICLQRAGRPAADDTDRPSSPIADSLHDSPTSLKHPTIPFSPPLAPSPVAPMLPTPLRSIASRKIVAYGVGNFSRGCSPTYYGASLWQLAILVALQQDVPNEVAKSPPSTLVYYYDPCSTTFEKEFLIEVCKFQVLEANEQGRRCLFPQMANDRARPTTVDATSTNSDHIEHKGVVFRSDEANGNLRDEDSSKNNLTTDCSCIVPIIFFMPHCPCKLYENVLRAHWEIMGKSAASSMATHSVPKVLPLFIVGNSLRRHMVESLPSRTDCPCMQAALPFLHETRIDSRQQNRAKNGRSRLLGREEDHEPPIGNWEGAINDTYATIFLSVASEANYLALPVNKLLSATVWPRYPPENTIESGGDDPELL